MTQEDFNAISDIPMKIALALRATYDRLDDTTKEMLKVLSAYSKERETLSRDKTMRCSFEITQEQLKAAITMLAIATEKGFPASTAVFHLTAEKPNEVIAAFSEEVILKEKPNDPHTNWGAHNMALLAFRGKQTT